MFENPSDDILRSVLATPRSIAVVGCSPDPSRDSHQVAVFLKSKGHRIVPVNPSVAAIWDEPCYSSLRDIHLPIEIVDIFRRAEQAGEVVDEAIAIGAKIVWMQLGVVDEAAARRAQAAGLLVVMDRCPKIEYRRLFR